MEQYQTYTYTYRMPDGQVKSGTIQATSLEDAKKKFREMPLDKSFVKLKVERK